MSTLKPALTSIAIISMLGISLAALADSNNAKAFKGIVVEDILVMENIPDEVQSGSIKIKGANDHTIAGLASISSGEAATIAIRALPGKVIETRLDNENGFLVWEVELITTKGKETELMIDAGNGYLLAAEVSDEEGDEDHEDDNEDKHFNWKFWEDNDQDEHQNHN